MEREKILLDGLWKFAYTKTAPDILEGTIPAEEAFEIQMPVPAYWDDCRDRLRFAKFWARDCNFNPARRIEEFPMGGLKPPDASLPYLLGTGWYKKTVFVPKEWKGKCIDLHIGGGMLDVWVWMNNRYVGTHYSCGKPFYVTLDDFVKYGEENELVIAVSNTRTNKNGCLIRGFKGKSAGLNRSVELSASENARIEDCYVRTTSAMDKLVWNVKIRKKCREGFTLRWGIKQESGGVVIGRGFIEADTEELCFETETFGMKCWSDKEPELYTLCLEIEVGKSFQDYVEQSYGLRYMERKGTGIYMNNSPLFLRGITEHAYYAETCTAPNEVSYYMKAIRALKKAGFNWMRFHTIIPPEECLEAADRLGMLLQVETQNGFEESDFVDMLLLCRKHPCVILYCCGNEVPITDEFEEKLEKMGEYCHTLAPDCLYDPMEALLNVECRLDENAPGYTEKPVPYNALKLGRIREYSDVLATGVWVFSYHALYPDVDKISERFAIYERPCLIHEAGIFDTYLNLDLEKRYEKTRIGTDMYAAVRNYVDEMGMLKNAPVYYQNSCKWMKLLMKFTLEKARRCHSVAGYDFLGGYDTHWHRTGYAIGVMNEFLELKAGFTEKELQQFNGESVLLSDAAHERSLFAGDKTEVELFASLFGGSNLEKGILSWALVDDNGKVRLFGSYEVMDVQEGSAVSLGTITIGLDEVRGTGEHLKLEAELQGGIYRISNAWDYWIFHKPECISENTFKVTDNITEQDLNDMENGARILLLGSGPFGGLPITFQITPGGRVNGNCSTVIYDHPLMRRFPHDGFCDWQFAPMFRDGGAVVFNDLGITFNPILEIVSTYKMIKKQAGIFELAVGKGGLLVCTMNVLTKDPAAQVLLNCMKEYLASKEFAPKVHVTTEKMREIMKMNQNVMVDFTTDECYDTGGHIEV